MCGQNIDIVDVSIIEVQRIKLEGTKVWPLE